MGAVCDRCERRRAGASGRGQQQLHIDVGEQQRDVEGRILRSEAVTVTEVHVEDEPAKWRRKGPAEHCARRYEQHVLVAATDGVRCARCVHGARGSANDAAEGKRCVRCARDVRG
eukprot:3945331-Prymnesium_polylepis.2